MELSQTIAMRRPTPRRSGDGWRIGLIAVASFVALPIIAIVVVALHPEENIWSHLSATVLPRYVANTIALLVGVAIGVVFLGVGAAWLTTTYDFPFRKLLEWLLLLPLAMPAYVIAYVYTDLFEFSGPVQSFLRALIGWETRRDYWFPEIRSLGGAIVMMSLVLYPYVYMLCRAAFLELSPNMVRSARILGLNPIRLLLTIIIPVIRPAVLLGASLALMEALNDFGTVDFFAVQTLSAGLYDTWLNMGNLGGAAQIAVVMLCFVALLLAAERISRRRQRFYQGGDRVRGLDRIVSRPTWRWSLTVLCLLPVLFGFLLPASILAGYAITYFDESFTPAFKAQTLNSLSLSVGTAVIATALALVVAYAGRYLFDRYSKALQFMAILGYAMPAVILALGIIVAFSAFDRSLNAISVGLFDVKVGQFFGGGIFAIVCAYTIRFLAISVTTIESSMSRITPSMELAARSLGFSRLRTLAYVHVPLLHAGLLTAVLVIFVECMKELPATLILRPFNFDTLAVGVYQQASDELIERAALGALVIVLVGVLPVIVLSRAIQSRPGSVTRKSIESSDHGETALKSA